MLAGKPQYAYVNEQPQQQVVYQAQAVPVYEYRAGAPELAAMERERALLAEERRRMEFNQRRRAERQRDEACCCAALTTLFCCCCVGPF